MNHPGNEEWMAYLYGEADRAKESELRAHLKTCDQCQARVRDWQSAMGRLDRWRLPDHHDTGTKSRPVRQWVFRWAVAAVVMVAFGYVIGQLTAGGAIDQQQLIAELESSLTPVIREELLAELDDRRRQDLADSYVLLKDELGRQVRHDLNQYAVQTLTASGALTNRLLSELVEAIDQAQNQDRLWVAAAIEQIEFNRLKDSTLLTNGLAALAVNTSDEFQRTREDMTKLLVYNQPENLNQLNERNKK